MKQGEYCYKCGKTKTKHAITSEDLFKPVNEKRVMKILDHEFEPCVSLKDAEFLEAETYRLGVKCDVFEDEIASLEKDIETFWKRDERLADDLEKIEYLFTHPFHPSKENSCEACLKNMCFPASCTCSCHSIDNNEQGFKLLKKLVEELRKK